MSRLPGWAEVLQKVGKLVFNELVGGKSLPFAEGAPESQQQKQGLVRRPLPAPLPDVDAPDSLKEFAATHHSTALPLFFQRGHPTDLSAAKVRHEHVLLWTVAQVLQEPVIVVGVCIVQALRPVQGIAGRADVEATPFDGDPLRPSAFTDIDGVFSVLEVRGLPSVSLTSISRTCLS